MGAATPPDSLDPKPSDAERQRAAGERPRVLVVEDDEDIMRALSIRLRVNGFEVVAAGSLREALERSAEGPLEAAVFDVSFPGGDGMQLTRELRSRGATAALPVMILTASMRPGVEAEALSAGATGFMRKPYDATALVSALSAWCDGGSALGTRQQRCPSDVRHPPIPRIERKRIAGEE